MQFIKSISNIIKYIQSINFEPFYTYNFNNYDDECNCSNYLICSCDDICYCGCEDCDCELPSNETSLQCKTDNTSQTEEPIMQNKIANTPIKNSKYYNLDQTDYAKTIETIYSCHPNGIITCLKKLEYYNVNTQREKITSKWLQLISKLDIFTEYHNIENITVNELFSRYDIEPYMKTINYKVERAFKLSKFIGTDDWINFTKELTDDECEKLLDIKDN